MREFVLREAGMRIAFRLREDDVLELVDFSSEAAAGGIRDEWDAAPDGVWRELSAADPHDLPPRPLAQRNADGHQAYQLIALQITGRSSLDETHGGKHVGGSDSSCLRYVGHELVWEDARRHLTIHLRSSASSVEADYHMLLFPGIAMVRVWTELRNVGDEPVGIDYVSSFLYTGLGHTPSCENTTVPDAGRPAGTFFPAAGSPEEGGRPGACSDRAVSSLPCERLRVGIPANSWDAEAQWTVRDLSSLGVSRMAMDGFNLPEMGTDRFTYGSIGSWSTGRYLPIALVQDPQTGALWYGQIEHSGSWQIEYGTCWGRNVYLALMGPDNESEWWKELAPGESFTTVPAGFGTCRGPIPAEDGAGGPDAGAGEGCDAGSEPGEDYSSGSGESRGDLPGCDFTAAFDALTLYRRAIREDSADDGRRSVVFNDYMNCLFGDPTEARELPMIERAARLGAEVYCIDAGWYDDGPWWNRIGEWRQAPGRFPNGLKSVVDEIRSKGMRAGLWIEIEAMGTACALSQRLPDDWFICRHGKRRVDTARYLLDFRNPAVRQYCTDVIDRLTGEYGVTYFKIDYNVTTGAGSDVGADSPGDALLEHVRCLYGWIREQYARHPGLLIENCGSGAQRMDYGILSLHSLQSTSDNTDAVTGALIASNIASAVTPEQAGQWVYPYRDEREHVIWCMVSGLLLRPYLSGNIWAMSEDNLALMKEGVDLYKNRIRGELGSLVPFWPMGMQDVHSGVYVYGLKPANGIAGRNAEDGADEIAGRNTEAQADESVGRPAEDGADGAAAADGSGLCGELPAPGRPAQARHAYLAVFFARQTGADIPLDGLLPDASVFSETGESACGSGAPAGSLRAEVIYPSSGDCAFRIAGSVLHASVDAPERARMFEIAWA